MCGREYVRAKARHPRLRCLSDPPPPPLRCGHAGKEEDESHRHPTCGNRQGWSCTFLGTSPAMKLFVEAAPKQNTPSRLDCGVRIPVLPPG
eukprot:scaffold24151_cov90-Isochrysis_galbana.AAC.1